MKNLMQAIQDGYIKSPSKDLKDKIEDIKKVTKTSIDLSSLFKKVDSKKVKTPITATIRDGKHLDDYVNPALTPYIDSVLNKKSSAAIDLIKGHLEQGKAETDNKQQTASNNVDAINTSLKPESIKKGFVNRALDYGVSEKCASSIFDQLVNK